MGEIDEVKQKLDIVEVVGRHVTLSKAGRNFKAPCPFHSERTPSFFVFPERQSWHCFGACGTGGDVFSFVMKQQGMEFGEALHLLADQAGVTLSSKPREDARKDERDRICQANEAAARFYHDALLSSRAAARARQYLLDRGFNAESVAAFNLGYSPSGPGALKAHLLERGYSEKTLVDAGLLIEREEGNTRDRFRNRLMFPIRDVRGRTTGFGGRVLDDSFPKYTNSPQTLAFDKSGTLYGIEQAAQTIRKQDRAVLVEGYFDAITAHQHGFLNVVASMGTAITERQVDILKRLTHNVTLALDADAAGEEAMLRCVDYENTLDAEVQVIVLPDGRDPDDVIRQSPDRWRELVDQAVPVVDFAFDMKTAPLDMGAARDKSLATRELLPIIARMKDAVRRDHYLSKLAFLTGIRYNILEASLLAHTSRGRRKASTVSSRVSTPQPTLRSHTEEDCLSLLLQHPELKDRSEGPLPEHFLNSQNREIFAAWQEHPDLPSLQDRLDPALLEQVEYLASRNLPGDQLDRRYRGYALRLREDFLRDREMKREAAFAEEARAGGHGADLARLAEEGIDPSTQLKEVFAQKHRAQRSGRKDES